jgi:hypothetical protein
MEMGQASEARVQAKLGELQLCSRMTGLEAWTSGESQTAFGGSASPMQGHLHNLFVPFCRPLPTHFPPSSIGHQLRISSSKVPYPTAPSSHLTDDHRKASLSWMHAWFDSHLPDPRRCVMSCV